MDIWYDKDFSDHGSKLSLNISHSRSEHDVLGKRWVKITTSLDHEKFEDGASTRFKIIIVGQLVSFTPKIHSIRISRDRKRGGLEIQPVSCYRHIQSSKPLFFTRIPARCFLGLSKMSQKIWYARAVFPDISWLEYPHFSIGSIHRLNQRVHFPTSYVSLDKIHCQLHPPKTGESCHFWVRRFSMYMILLTEKIPHQLIQYGKYPIIFRVSYMSGGWEWDFWTINSTSTLQGMEFEPWVVGSRSVFFHPPNPGSPQQLLRFRRPMSLA